MWWLDPIPNFDKGCLCSYTWELYNELQSPQINQLKLIDLFLVNTVYVSYYGYILLMVINMPDASKHHDKITYIKKDFRFLEFGNRYYHKELVTDTTSLPLRLPIDERNVIVSVEPTGTALVQYTISPDEDIVNDDAVWHDWPEGTVATKFIDAAHGSITALRLVSTGTTTWEVSI